MWSRNMTQSSRQPIGAIGDDAAAPPVEHMTPWIGKGPRSHALDLTSLWVVPHHPGILEPLGTLGRFDLCVVEHALLEVNASIGWARKGRHCVMAVFTSKPMQHNRSLIAHTITIGINNVQ